MAPILLVMLIVVQVQLDNSGTVVSDPICCPAGTLMCTEQGETECCIGFTIGVDFCPSGGGCPPPQSF